MATTDSLTQIEYLCLNCACGCIFVLDAFDTGLHNPRNGAEGAP